MVRTEYDNFFPPWTRPWIILKKYDKYDISYSITRWKVSKVVHIDRLEKYAGKMHAELKGTISDESSDEQIVRQEIDDLHYMAGQ